MAAEKTAVKGSYWLIFHGRRDRMNSTLRATSGRVVSRSGGAATAQAGVLEVLTAVSLTRSPGTLCGPGHVGGRVFTDLAEEGRRHGRLRLSWEGEPHLRRVCTQARPIHGDLLLRVCPPRTTRSLCVPLFLQKNRHLWALCKGRS